MPDPSIVLFLRINMVSGTSVGETEIIEPETQVFQAAMQDVIINEVEISDHNQAEGLECSICSKTFKTKKTLKQHLKLIHQNGPPELPQNPVNKKCCVCNQYFTSTQFHQHMKNVHPEYKRKVNCDLCAETFTSLFNLKRHKQCVHNKNKQFECQNCVYITQRADLMKEHMKIHMEKTFQCEKCEKFRTNRERELAVHIKKCKAKPHKCDLCENNSLSAAGLKQHKQRNHA